MKTFLEANEVRLVAAAAVSAGTAVESSVVAVDGAEQVTFFCTIATANAANFLKVQGGDASNAVSTDLEGTKVVAAANGDVVSVTVVNSQYPYLQAYIERGGANTATGDVYCVRSGLRKQPADNNVDSEIVSEIHVAPAAGTA